MDRSVWKLGDNHESQFCSANLLIGWLCLDCDSAIARDLYRERQHEHAARVGLHRNPDAEWQGSDRGRHRPG